MLATYDLSLLYNQEGYKMAKEIERKFLVRNSSWKDGLQGLLCRQGYLVKDENVTVRVRIIGELAYLTIKGRTEGFSRDEFEYQISQDDARIMLATMSGNRIVEKIRYKVEANGMIWDVDEFLGNNAGLVMAEVELTDESQQVVLPDWAGEEVTGDRRYYNSYLAEIPFLKW